MNTGYVKRLLVRLFLVSTILLIALSPLGGVRAADSTAYAVNTTDDNDDGACNSTHCSLREAINAANAHPGADAITFNLRGSASFSIQPLSALPEITSPVTIDGSTQPGFQDNPMIELDGSKAGEGEPEVEIHGLVISAGDSTVKALAINRFSGIGIVLATNGGNTIQGNFIGADLAGTAALGNLDGVDIQGGSSGNLIGGAQAHAGNLISGNRLAGIRLRNPGTEGNKVQGNLIGTDLSGTNPLGNGSTGVVIVTGASGNLIGGTEEGARNIISSSGYSGIWIRNSGTTGNTVQGNFIGTDRNGTRALANASFGVVISDGAAGNLIGGKENGARNVISGNPVNVGIGGAGTTGNTMQGNYIGIDNTGSAVLPNTDTGVIIIAGASGNLIGGASPGAGNVISGSARWGVLLGNSGVTGNVLQGNFIGTDASGTKPRGNLEGGVFICDKAADNLIGGAEPGAGNKIAFNGGEGIGFGSYEAGPLAGSGNALLSNSDFANGRQGIDLGDDGVTPNDLRDQDSGPNDLQNYPVISAVSTMSTPAMVLGILKSTPSTTFRLEFFSNHACDPSGSGEGEAFLGFAEVMTDPEGFVRFLVRLALPEGAFVTATATNPAGNTSEFSRCFSSAGIDRGRSPRE